MKEFDKLIELIKKLRDPKKGCPWDIKQTPETLKKHILEEAYELVDAIDKKKNDQIMEEAGDHLLQTIFLSEIYEEKGIFNIKEVLNSLMEKLTLRHPHIFGNVKVKNAQEVKKNWEKIKNTTKQRESVISEYPSSMPSLNTATRISEQAANTGFDWKKKEDVISKIDEEFNEVKEAIKNQNMQNCEEEIGDLLFAICNLARHCEIDPETALKKCNKKFTKRFRFIEKYLRERNQNINETDLMTMEKIWNISKQNERNSKNGSPTRI